MRDWYLPPQAAQSEPRRQIAWGELFEEWAHVELDLHDRFGIDAESGVFLDRTWRWLYLRILDLVADPSTRIGAHVATPEDPEGVPV